MIAKVSKAHNREKRMGHFYADPISGLPLPTGVSTPIIEADTRWGSLGVANIP
jgi:hypothetical protein